MIQYFLKCHFSGPAMLNGDGGNKRHRDQAANCTSLVLPILMDYSCFYFLLFFRIMAACITVTFNRQFESVVLTLCCCDVQLYAACTELFCWYGCYAICWAALLLYCSVTKCSYCSFLCCWNTWFWMLQLDATTSATTHMDASVWIVTEFG